MAIIHSLKYTVPFLLLVPLFVILLSLAVICSHSLSLVATRCTTRCHSLSLVVPLVVTRFHSLALDVPLVCLFINDHTTGTILCKYVFLFCATLNMFNQYESSVGCHIFFFFCHNKFFCDSHDFGAQRWLLWEIFFLLTQHFFVLYGGPFLPNSVWIVDVISNHIWIVDVISNHIWTSFST